MLEAITQRRYLLPFKATRLPQQFTDVLVIGGGVAEVGVVTSEAHRGQGLASIAIAWLAADLAERGLGMYWSCDTDNEASVRVAGKLGFGPARPFGILLYRQLA